LINEKYEAKKVKEENAKMEKLLNSMYGGTIKKSK
jgi:hypothetical protein